MTCVSWPYTCAKLGAKAKMAILQGKEIKFDEGKELGLLNELVDKKPDVDKKIQDVLGRLQHCPPEGLAHAKRYIYSIQGTLPSLEFQQYTTQVLLQSMAGSERRNAS